MTAAASVRWDAVVIGTGLGGAHAGARLVQAGMKVLFVERGTRPPDAGDPAPLEQLEADVTVNGRAARRVPTSLSAVGGTSVVYAASLELPARHDLDDLEEAPHPTGGWIVGYDGFRPYFSQARRLVGICGTRDALCADDGDPFADPPPLCAGDAEIRDDLARRGYHPYRAHLGIAYRSPCQECIGRECFRACKADARQPLGQALDSGRAALLSGWTARRIEADGTAATGVVVGRAGQDPVTLAADRVVLAGGAIGSAQLLLASRGAHWADGIGNREGLVGRNLMFHLSERMAVFPRHRAPLGFPAKSLALRDLYLRDGTRMGMVQSMGLQADYGNILMHLRGRFDRGRLHRARPLRPFLRIPAKIAALALGNARVFVGILEDLPYGTNRILPGSNPLDPPAIVYDVAPELAERRRLFRRAIREMFGGRRFFFLNDDVELNYGHACGTARFGRDPRDSVLDADCRVHGLRNLYVTDASFMPTSTGVNPGLVILANSLRVADRIVAAR
ncbi:glucose-methanol-choline oxidoreductase [Paracoccus sp. YIM 132242]|uniref:Glucose-methanol-choline oxidoreductase n=2 Tax=Paracoccus lichenicola TaxID=2665644 RepID=A0A6L6HTH0_9RHOB|nr:glucose-methanol-choline oxidoreductase [Paracoccus lichenicola]